MKRTPLILCFIIFLTGFSFGQITADEARSARMDARIKANLEGARRREDIQQPPLRSGIPWGVLTKEQKKLLTPSAEITEKYKNFLKGSKTGIAKLLPNPKCDPRVLNVNNVKCLQMIPIIGNGSRYSFKEKTHLKPLLTDISFTDDVFSSGFWGLFVDLENADINLIDSGMEEIKFLNSFALPKKQSELLPQMLQLQKGFVSNNKFYSTRIPAKSNNTYAMRSASHYYDGSKYVFNDITVAFRVVEKDSDGAVTLIWKELKKGKNVKVSR